MVNRKTLTIIIFLTYSMRNIVAKQFTSSAVDQLLCHYRIYVSVHR